MKFRIYHYVNRDTCYLHSLFEISSAEAGNFLQYIAVKSYKDMQMILQRVELLIAYYFGLKPSCISQVAHY